MRIKEILLEYNLQNLLSLFSEKYKQVQKKDHSNEYESLEEFIKSIEEYSKKENKFQFIEPYMKWIVQRYVTNNLGLYEDVMSKAVPGLLRYDSLKRKNKLKSNHKDINQVKNIDQFLDVLDEYRDEDTKSISEREKEIEQNFYKNGEAELLYNDSNFKVVIPKSEKASCFFGRNTRWCTAATNSRNYFKDYNKKGPLYIIIDKKNNKRFQFHFKVKQFMDEKDKQIDLEEFKENYPVLSNLFNKIEKANYKTKFFTPHEELTNDDILKFLVSENPALSHGFKVIYKRREILKNEEFQKKYINLIKKRENYVLLIFFINFCLKENIDLDEKFIERIIMEFEENIFTDIEINRKVELDEKFYKRYRNILLKDNIRESFKKIPGLYIYIYGKKLNVLDLFDIIKFKNEIGLENFMKIFDSYEVFSYEPKIFDIVLEDIIKNKNEKEILEYYYEIITIFSYLWRVKKLSKKGENLMKEFSKIILNSEYLTNHIFYSSLVSTHYDFMDRYIKNDIEKVIISSGNIGYMKYLDLNKINLKYFLRLLEKMLEKKHHVDRFSITDSFYNEIIMNIFGKLFQKEKNIDIAFDIIRVLNEIGKSKQSMVFDIIYYNKKYKYFAEIIKTKRFVEYVKEAIAEENIKSINDELEKILKNIRSEKNI
ncbi:MAG: hypothetical protein NZZ41_00705 [Candidatus Dojkabacteria bacterium]|nr:hypothetical protein [Candidatus Dojkabacteria bacterium]